MTFRGYLAQARDELLDAGERVTPNDLFERACQIEGGWEAWSADRDKSARQKALRDASALLSEVEGYVADPAVGRLFDVVDYSPPRAITFQRDGDVQRHVAIEHATWEEARGSDECHGYSGVLKDNIESAVQRERAFDGFLSSIEPYMASGNDARIVDALRRMAAEAA